MWKVNIVVINVQPSHWLSNQWNIPIASSGSSVLSKFDGFCND
jgi:hypothetical protein